MKTEKEIQTKKQIIKERLEELKSNIITARPSRTPEKNWLWEESKIKKWTDDITQSLGL